MTATIDLPALIKDQMPTVHMEVPDLLSKRFLRELQPKNSSLVEEYFKDVPFHLLFQRLLASLLETEKVISWVALGKLEAYIQATWMITGSTNNKRAPPQETIFTEAEGDQ